MLIMGLAYLQMAFSVRDRSPMVWSSPPPKWLTQSPSSRCFTSREMHSTLELTDETLRDGLLVFLNGAHGWFIHAKIRRKKCAPRRCYSRLLPASRECSPCLLKAWLSTSRCVWSRSRMPIASAIWGNLSRSPSCSRLYYWFPCCCRRPSLRARRSPVRPLNFQSVLIFTILLVQHLTSLRSPWEIRKATGK